MNMDNFYRQFCNEGFDKFGILRYFKPVYPDNFNFGYDVIDEIADMDPDRRALMWCNEAGEYREFTFGDIKKYSNKAANLMAAYGIKKGDVVLLTLKRHYQFWFIINGIHKLGAVVVPATIQLTSKDLAYRFNAAGVKAVISTTDGDVADSIDEACQQCPDLKIKFSVNGKRDGWIHFDEELEQTSEELTRIETLATDPMLMYFTSGTTGYPKIALHDFTYPLGHIISAKHWHNVDCESIHLTVSDTGWAKCAWGKIYGEWICAATIFVYDFDRFDPHDLLKMIEKYRITSFCAPPTIYRFFIKEGMEDVDLSSLKYATTAGEALNAEVYNKFLKYTGLKIMEAFGQSETTAVTVNLVGTTPKPGSMGKPSPLYDVKIIDEDEEPVEIGAVGEVVISTDKKVPGMFTQYYKNEEATQKAWHDGFYHTGDTAWQDEDGFMWYVGRIDDVIKASGYRIGPFEIESVLIEHPAVLECAVTGAPDPIRGTVVKATIVLTKNTLPSDELKKELQNYVKHQTAPYKYPRIIEFVDELPKTFSGKIRRVAIRNQDTTK